MATDLELLREHVERGSEDAFRALVERHAGMVRAAALRVVRDEHTADEVTQAVFTLFARKASRLGREVIIAGWLYRAAHNLAREALRRGRRREENQQLMVSMNDETPPAEWQEIAPHLEEAMSRLRGADRDALVLRFFQEKSFAELAAVLQISEAAAKMRVGRALEKLRKSMANLGVAIPAATLMAAMGTFGAAAASPAVAGSIASVALANVASTSAFAFWGVNIMLFKKFKIAAVIAAVLLLASTAAIITKSIRTEEPPNALRKVVADFMPMAGDWEGTYEVTGGTGILEPTPVSLSVITRGEGRACDIAMYVLGANGRTNRVFRFSHTLNADGTRIHTVDDPGMNHVIGEGLVNESFVSDTKSEWRAGFHARNPDGSYTSCRWWCEEDRLTITREDSWLGERASDRMYATLELTRRAPPRTGAGISSRVALSTRGETTNR